MKSKPAKKPTLPEWASEPLKFSISPDDALRKAMDVKPPKDWRKVIKTGRRTRR